MHIGILQTGHAPEGLAGDLGTYPQLFARLLAGHGFDFTTWSVCDGDRPPGPDAADGWLITGSRHGAYEDHDWIAPLERFIRDLHAARKPLVGICFGHQIIAQALGGRVEKFAGGWSVGRRDYRFGDRTLHLNAWHQDQVVALPDGARIVGENDFCAYAALAWGDHIFTVQPHPEFGAPFIRGLIDTRGRGIVPDALLHAAEGALDAPVDNDAMGDLLARFLKGEAHV